MKESKPTIADQRTKPGVWIKTFGCQMNEYDSEKMLALLANTHARVDSPEQAELILVNTCSVRDKAEHKLFSLLGKINQYKEANPQLVVGVGGCVAQQEGSQILRRSKVVDFVIGTHNLSLIPSLVVQSKETRRRQAVIDYREEWEELPDEFDALPLEQNKPFSANNHQARALVAIQRGCDKKCSFCVVPTTRGPQVSRCPKEIEKELRLKVRMGAREVLLLGQTVNSYGLDLSPRIKFEDLIRQIAEIEGLDRIRFTSPHPTDVRPGFINLYGEIPQLSPHIHLPLQSGSDRILKLMNRNYRRSRYLEIVAALKERVPEIAITTDVIVGFPTETPEDFEETLELLQQVRYHATYSFKYSVRPNTTAQASYSGEQLVAPEVATERLTRYQSQQEEISREINHKLVGQEVEVLVEGRQRKVSSTAVGRIPQNTLVQLRECSAKAGQLVRAVIEGASPHCLMACPVSLLPSQSLEGRHLERALGAGKELGELAIEN